MPPRTFKEAYVGQKVSMTIGHLPITDHLILGMVRDQQEEGTKSFQHFTLTTRSLGGWPDLVSRMDSGELDGAFMLSPSAMDLYRSGTAIKMVLLGHKTGSIFIKRKGAPIQTVKDFRGQTIIIPYQMSVHYMLLHRMLVENGLEPHVDVKFETLAPSQMPEALEYGEEDGIGGFIVAEPFGSFSIKAGHGELFALSKDLWPRHPCCVFVVRQDLVEREPQAVGELVNALVEAGRQAESDPAYAAEVGSVFLGQEASLIHSILTDPADRIMTGELLPQLGDFDIMQNYMVDHMKVLKGKIRLEDFVDLRFARDAGAD